MILDPFQEEFDLLTNTIAWNLKLKAETPNFVDCKLVNKFKSAEETENSWHLSDLAEGGDAWALFKLCRDPRMEQKIEVLRCNLSLIQKLRRSSSKLSRSVKLILDRLSPSAFNAIAENERSKRE